MLPGGFLEGYEIPLAEGCCYDPKLVDPMSTKPCSGIQLHTFGFYEASNDL